MQFLRFSSMTSLMVLKLAFNDTIQYEKDEDLDEIIHEKYEENRLENLSLVDIKTYKPIGNISTDKSRYKVIFSEEQEMLMTELDNNSIIAIHNHPSNSTFSRGDINMILENNEIGGIIVTTEKYNYYLKPKVEMLEATRKNKDAFNKYFNECLADINDEIFDRHLSFNNNTHCSYSIFFRKIGWEYGREKKVKRI